MGALEAPQDRHKTGTQDGDLQSGTDRTEAPAEQGALETMAGSLRGLIPWPGHSSQNPSTPPHNFFFPWGSWGVSGALWGQTKRNKTGQPSGARQTGQDKTGQDSPQEQEALLG